MTTPPPTRLPWGYLAALAALLLVITNALVVGESPRPRARRERPAAAAPVPSAAQVEAPAPPPRRAPPPEATTPPLPLVPSTWWLALGLTPAALLIFSLFHPDVSGALRAAEPRRVATLAGAVVAWTLLVPAVRFDPYWLVIALAAATAPILALRLDRSPGRLTALGLLVWLCWWIPFDLRWAGQLWLGPPGLGYAAPSLLVTALGLLAFGVVARPDAGADETDPLRPPTPRDLGVGLGMLVALGVIVIPLGLVTGFLKTPHAPDGTFDEVTAQLVLKLIGIGITVALPEEVYFRAVLDAGLRTRLRPLPSLALSSVLFGLMHWNNRPDRLNEQLAYLLLASIAGAFYGLAYRRGGLFAAVLCHTLVDVIWKAVL